MIFAVDDSGRSSRLRGVRLSNKRLGFADILDSEQKEDLVRIIARFPKVLENQTGVHMCLLWELKTLSHFAKSLTLFLQSMCVIDPPNTSCLHRSTSVT
jgi:hypothetical protein